MRHLLHLLLLLLLLCHARPSSALDFLLNSFNTSNNLILVEDARIDPAAAVLSLTNDTNQFSYGRAFYPSRIPMRHSNNSGSGGGLSSFSTSFVFSILPEISTSPGFGLAFVLSNSTAPNGALAGQYFGLFTNATTPVVVPLLAVEFDVGMNPEFNDPDGNHVGIDLNNMVSASTETARYFSSASGGFVPIDMRSGQNVRAWIDFDGPQFQFNITIAPAGVARPSIPLLTYADPAVAQYVSDEMYVGFSASKTTWVEAQRILAWSFSDTGLARDINTTKLPHFSPVTASSSLSGGVIVGITLAGLVLFGVLCLSGVLWCRRCRGKKNNRKEEGDDDGIEGWEFEYWPHRFSYDELNQATGGFADRNLIGSGGFGKVYKGVLKNCAEVAVKCVNHDSKQGLREFMAEISSTGRLRHKSLVQMRGWCRRQNQLMLVYDFMPNGSLNRWIFDSAETVLDWPRRRRVLADVAEGLNYLHHGWDQVVVHRDIKSSNVLLDADMRARLGDFGLAKLYSQGEAPTATRLVGTLGYLAPELARSSTPTAASDVYSFGVVVMEVACGRRPIDTRRGDEEQVLVDWVSELYRIGGLAAAADRRIATECSPEEAEAVLKLGLACCHPDPLRRPSMKEVVAVLLGEELPAEIPPPIFPSNLTSAGDGHGHGVEAQFSCHDPHRH